MSRRSGPVEMQPLSVSAVKHITEKAILVVHDGEPKWIPKSQVHEPDEIEKTDEQTEIHVSAWFIKKEGLQ